MGSNTESAPGELTGYLPDELQKVGDEAIDWDALCREMGRSRKMYELPTTPSGDDEMWLDKLEIVQDVSRYIRDGGSIDVDEVLV